MIEMKMPKDIRRYETKLIGPLTGRQVVCSILAVISVLGVTFGLNPMLPADLGRGLQLLSVVPFGLIGWYKPYGMHFEDFFITWLYASFLSPSKRKYANHNRCVYIAKAIHDEEVKSKKNKKHSKSNKKGE